MRAAVTRRLRVPVAVVATGLAGVLATGSAAALQMSGAAPALVTAVQAQTGPVAPAPADQRRTVRPQGAVRPSPVETTLVADVAPLSGLHTPDVVVRSATPLAPELVQRLRALPGVSASALIDVGTVTVGGRPAGLVGADPSELRGFTPQESAASDPLWQAVARGELAVSYSLQQQRSLELGAEAVVSERPSRVGAVAGFGLPRAEVVAARGVARELGALPDSALVLAAPELKTAALRKAVLAVAGGQVEVELLRPPDVAPSQLKGRPGSWRELYVDSARYCPGLRWQVLAAIGQVESAHGRHLGPSSAGALGPMQFMPATWDAYGLDGDADGVADIMSPFDAVPSAAHYLCRSGATRGEQGLYDAIFAYNHADWYVRKVLAVAEQYQ